MIPCWKYKNRRYPKLFFKDVLHCSEENPFHWNCIEWYRAIEKFLRIRNTSGYNSVGKKPKLPFKSWLIYSLKFKNQQIILLLDFDYIRKFPFFFVRPSDHLKKSGFKAWFLVVVFDWFVSYKFYWSEMLQNHLWLVYIIREPVVKPKLMQNLSIIYLQQKYLIGFKLEACTKKTPVFLASAELSNFRSLWGFLEICFHCRKQRKI